MRETKAQNHKKHKINVIKNTKEGRAKIKPTMQFSGAYV